MRVWIDITAPAHVLVFRPLIDILRGRGDEVGITARDYAQTVELLALHGLEADEVIGRHGGRSRLQKARQMTSRLGALRRWARGRDFDVALAARAPQQQTAEDSRAQGGRYKVKIDKGVRGTINGGGQEIQFRNFNGNIYIRRASGRATPAPAKTQ